MKKIFTSILLITFALNSKGQDKYVEHFIAERYGANDFVIEGMLSDSLNKILNKLEVVEVWIDYDSRKYKIQSKTSNFNVAGDYYASDGGTAGYRYYCYIADSKQKLTIVTARCAEANCDSDEFLEIYGGDDFYVSFNITKRL